MSRLTLEELRAIVLSNTLKGLHPADILDLINQLERAKKAVTFRPRVGVAVIVINDGRVLMGRRQSGSGHGSQTWSFPGGKLEFGESLEHCAARELLEETGLRAEQFRFGLQVTNDIFSQELQHWVTFYLVTDWVKGEPQARESHKQSEWGWFDWDNLPQPLFLPVQNLLGQEFRPEGV